MSEGKQRAQRIKLQTDFEIQLIDVYYAAAEKLTDEELTLVVNRFASKVLPTGPATIR